MTTYEIKRPGGQWSPAGDDIETAEAAVKGLNDRSQPSTIVWVRNNFNGSVTVFETQSIGPVGNRGSYQRFYGTTELPS